MLREGLGPSSLEGTAKGGAGLGMARPEASREWLSLSPHHLPQGGKEGLCLLFHPTKKNFKAKLFKERTGIAS